MERCAARLAQGRLNAHRRFRCMDAAVLFQLRKLSAAGDALRLREQRCAARHQIRAGALRCEQPCLGSVRSCVSRWNENSLFLHSRETCAWAAADNPLFLRRLRIVARALVLERWTSSAGHGTDLAYEG